MFNNRSDVWISIQVDTDPEMIPRLRIASVGYALKAEIAASPRDCPSGMLEVSDDTCIESVKRTAAAWKSAVNTCTTASRRLCSAAEALGAIATGVVSNIDGNGEYVDNLFYRHDTTDFRAIRVFGDESVGQREISTTHAYRCCLSR